jgi:hypothetical protein
MSDLPAVSPAGIPHAGTEDVVQSAIALTSACFGAGLLAAAQALPLHWVQGQVALLALLLIVLPATVVMTTRHLAGLVGIPAADYAQRVAIARWMVVGTLAAGLPLYRERLLHGVGNTNEALPPVAVGLALCWLVTEMAARLTRAWTLLQVQPWEVAGPDTGRSGPVSVETAGRVDRARVVSEMWRGWLAGGVGLALALLLQDQLAPAGHEIAHLACLLAFVLYSAGGLLLLSQMARARQVVFWRVAGLATPEDLERTWAGIGLRSVLLALLVIALLIGAHGLDLAHTAVAWAIALLVALIEPLSHWLQQSVNRAPSSCSGCDASPHGGVPPTLSKPPAHPTTLGVPDWLAHGWPVLLALVVVAILVRTYWGARQLGTGRGIWGEMLAILLRDLRLLLHLLWQPARRALAQVAALQRSSGNAPGQRAGRRHRIDWSQPSRAIIAIYLAALALAARRGYPRRPGQTPGEYAREMAARLPETDETIAAMTSIFMAARYGQAPMAEQDVSRIQASWNALRAVLRKI